MPSNSKKKSQSNAQKRTYQSSKKKSARRRKKALKRLLRRVTCAAAALLILAGIGYAGGVYYYKERFIPGTEINYVLCQNMTAKQAEEYLKKQAENYVIEIHFKEDKLESVAGNSIEYTYNADGKVTELLEKQNPFLWVKGCFKKVNYNAKGEARFNEALLKEKLNSFEAVKEKNTTAPQNAYIVYEKGKFEIKDEVPGNTVDMSALQEQVKNAILNGEVELSAEKAGVYVLPAVSKEDKSLQHQQEILNDKAAVTIVYTIGDQEEVLNGAAIKDWMTFDENGNYVEDLEKLKTNIGVFVNELAKKYNTVGRTRKLISTATGEEVIINPGNYGFRVDLQGEADQLLADIQSGVSVTREPVYDITAASHDENDIGDTYVEVDLTEQHLWYYKDGEVLMDSDFVSGTYTKEDRRTPGGAYYLKYKQKDQILRPAPNQDGSYAYESPVDYWMPFNGGIGFHDASWRRKFGGNIYKRSGSHGCINLPPSFAGKFYENIEPGCPIICFYR